MIEDQHCTECGSKAKCLAGESGRKLSNWYCPECDGKHHPQADLLEKLDMIRKAVERNPEQWWRKIHFEKLPGQWYTPENGYDFWTYVRSGFPMESKPQQVRVEGWVDAEVIEWAENIVSAGNQFFSAKVARALLQLVKEEGDG